MTRNTKRARFAAALGATAFALSGVTVAATAESASASCSTGPVGTPGSIPALSFSKRDWPLTGGLHMNTYNGSVSRNNGTVTAVTHLYNSYWGMGYKGQVFVKLYNGCNDLIGVTLPKTYGVEAKSWFWNANERRESWSDQVPTVVANRVARVEVVHNRVTGSPYQTYNQLRDVACAFWPSVSGGTTECPFPRL